MGEPAKPGRSFVMALAWAGILLLSVVFCPLCAPSVNPLRARSAVHGGLRPASALCRVTARSREVGASSTTYGTLCMSSKAHVPP